MERFYYDALVIGSGAAGFCAAARLKDQGKNVALLTENIGHGTSRNTGSDKQTYYKLSLGGEDEDSVGKMAQNLFSGGAVDGDSAMCEAALSARSFFYLVEAGVPFPSGRMGDYIGYKTDHDPYSRATSAGPLTSKYMVEALERKAKALGLPILDGLMAVEILHQNGKTCGVLALDRASGEPIAVGAPHVILATGGPAGIYADSVYPHSQSGSLSLAVDCGIALQNLTEWQYGLASLAPRWNVSGTYMQVLPRFVSVDGDGEEHEFLLDCFRDPAKALSTVFLKGYQWPFDCRKVMDGSSVIDLLVFYETAVKGRRVYLDFTKNPFCAEEVDFSALDREAYDYLARADALFGRPIDRLEQMNYPAVALYADKGVDLHRDYLEIALCAQHHNGGIAVDRWWQTSLQGLFAIGECAGTHGISRPGGSALNAGQVGALRAAAYIAKRGEALDREAFLTVSEEAAKQWKARSRRILSNDNNAARLIAQAQKKMSEIASAIRDGRKITDYREEVSATLADFERTVGVADASELWQAYRYRDILLAQEAVLTAMLDYASDRTRSSRGSAIICDREGILPHGLAERFRFRMTEKNERDRIQTVRREKNGKFEVLWRAVRPLVIEDEMFETVWRSYRENENIY